MSDNALTLNEHNVSITLDHMNRFEGDVQTIIEGLPGMSDEQIMSLANNAQKVEQCAWLLRGACARELKRRSATKLPGGRGKKDTEGVGVKQTLIGFAKESGVELRTVEQEISILDRFFADPEDDSVLNVDRQPNLEKTFFIAALAAPDPRAALAMAEDKRSRDGGYSTRQFKDDIKELEGGKTTEEVEDLYWVRVGLSQETKEKLLAIEEKRGQGHTEVVTYLIEKVYNEIHRKR